MTCDCAGWINGTWLWFRKLLKLITYLEHDKTRSNYQKKILIPELKHAKQRTALRCVILLRGQNWENPVRYQEAIIGCSEETFLHGSLHLFRLNNFQWPQRFLWNLIWYCQSKWMSKQEKNAKNMYMFMDFHHWIDHLLHDSPNLGAPCSPGAGSGWTPQSSPWDSVGNLHDNPGWAWFVTWVWFPIIHGYEMIP